MASTLVTQPPFAQQIQGVSSPLGVNVALQRGYMIWEKTMPTLYSGGGPLGDGRDVINFLFNPSTVSTDYNIGNATLQAAMLYQMPGDNTNLLAPLLQQTVSWQLYFDRTYELNYGGNSSAVNDPAVIGVQADVYQFMQFTGILASLSASQAAQQAKQLASQVSGSTSSASASLTSGGIMMMIPCYVVFGNAFQQMNNNTSNFNFNALASQLSFYGYISEWSVQYTHFTENMVPIRCSISVSFTMLPTPANPNPSTWRNPAQAGNGNVTVPFSAGYTPSGNNLLTGG